MALATAVLGVATSACGPTIRSFGVSPVVGCAGESVALDWDVRGHPGIELRLDPARGEEGAMSVAAEPAPDTLTVLLVAERGGKEATREVAVLLAPTRFWRDVTFLSTRAAGDTVWAEGMVAEKWRGFEIQEVAAAPGTGPLHVTHGGRDAELTADGRSSLELAGLPLAGDWSLRSVSAQPPPDRLRLRALVICTP